MRKLFKGKRLGVVTLLLLLSVGGASILWFGSARAKSLLGERPAVASATDRMPSDGTPWTYNFAGLPNGLPPSADWNFESGTQVADYNGEAEAYTAHPQNVRVENGALVIEAKPEAVDGRQYSSARINTLGKFDFEYGTLSVTMMLPKGTGTWPAAWLMPVYDTYKPQDFGIATNDPQAWALNGEIDFAESIGRISDQNIPAIHTYDTGQTTGDQYTPGYVADPYDQYHTYGVIKTPNNITFTIDGVPYASRSETSASLLDWPFNQRYYLILNLAVGGSWAGADGIDQASAPWLLKVKSISYSPST